MSGVYIAYAIVAWCYLGVGFSGYAAFGGLLPVPSACRLRSLHVTGLAHSHTVLGYQRSPSCGLLRNSVKMRTVRCAVQAIMWLTMSF